MEKILGAHDTLTGYKTKGFVSWLFKPMTKCQTRDIEELAEAGVTCYDLRVWRGRDEEWHYGHGVSEYKAPLSDPITLVSYIETCHEKYNYGKSLYVRFLLERPTNDGRERFIGLCKEMEQEFTDIIFIPARDKHTWEVLYNFGNTDEFVHEYHASVSGKGWRKFFPHLWHKKHGADYELQEGVNLVDFV